jgi:hypothetical protein
VIKIEQIPTDLEGENTGHITLWKDSRKIDLQPLTVNVTQNNQEIHAFVEGDQLSQAAGDITLNVSINDATGAPHKTKFGSDILASQSVTVGPILLSLNVTATAGQAPALSGTDLTTGTSSVPAVLLDASALYDRTNLLSLKFVQLASNSNNLGAGTGASMTDPANPNAPINYAYTFANGGTQFVDQWNDTSSFFYAADSDTSQANIISISSNDSPKLPLSESGASVIPAGAKSTKIDVSKTFVLYAVWLYQDGSILTLGYTNWSVEFAGTVSSNPGFAPDSKNGIYGNSHIFQLTNEPLDNAVLNGTQANAGGANWQILP